MLGSRDGVATSVLFVTKYNKNGRYLDVHRRNAIKTTSGLKND